AAVTPLMPSQQSSFNGTRTAFDDQAAMAATEASSLAPSKKPRPCQQAYSEPLRLTPCSTTVRPLSTRWLPETLRLLTVATARPLSGAGPTTAASPSPATVTSETSQIVSRCRGPLTNGIPPISRGSAIAYPSASPRRDLAALTPMQCCTSQPKPERSTDGGDPSCPPRALDGGSLPVGAGNSGGVYRSGFSRVSPRRRRQATMGRFQE